MLVVGRGLCRLCQPIVQVPDPAPHRMDPLTPATRWGTLGAGLLQRELSVSAQGAVKPFGVAVMPGTAAVGMR